MTLWPAILAASAGVTASVAIPFTASTVPSTVLAVPSWNCTLPPVAAGVSAAANRTSLIVADDVSVLEVAALFTVTVIAADRAPYQLASPPYAAKIWCAPGVRLEIAKAAAPDASVAVPSTVAPSRNCTAPVGAATPAGACGPTVAVQVTACPKSAEAALLVSPSVSVTRSTRCPNRAVASEFVPSPPYVARMSWTPAVLSAAVMLARPPTSAALPSDCAPSANCTLPLGALPVTVAVNVTACPGMEG